MLAFALHRRDLQRVVFAAVVVGLIVVAAGLSVIAWASTSVDRVERVKEEALVQRRIERSLERLVEDVNSASIWNDTVIAFQAGPDMDWLQLNLGDYYADYMDHEVTLAWDAGGRLVYASRESEPVDPARLAPFVAAISPMLDETRQAAGAPALRRAVGFDAVVNRSQIVRIGSDAWLFAASTVVPEDPTIRRTSVDPVIISGRRIGSVVDSMKSDLAIHDPRFSTEAEAAGASVPVLDRQGRAIGWLAWTPDRPGRELLDDAAPVVAAVLLILIAGAIVLIVWVNRVAQDFAANETALIEARNRAEAANLAKSRFLANMSHELRTPLNGVVGMAEVMAAGDLAPAQRVSLDVLRSAAGQLTELIEHLLLITRLERNEVAVCGAPFDPAATIRAAVNEHRPAARAKGLTLSRTMDDLGMRLGDEEHLRRVLGYLIDNAITYTRTGGVAVTGRATPTGLRITVSDTGVGIRADLMPHLFDLFVQGDDSLTKSYDGVGLGLAICRNLVKAMGGQISVQSDEGCGSTFAVDLPLPLAEANASLQAA